jgi:hypothetical protein
MNMNFKCFLLFILLISFISANSLTKINPQNIEDIEVKITRSGTIMSETGMFSNMNLVLSIPQNTYYQQVTIHDIEKGEIKKINESEILNFKKKESVNSFTYSFTSEVITSKRTINLPLNYTDGMENFIEESEHILINEEIDNKAKEITSKAENDLEKVALVAIWVNENMEYDIKEVGVNSNSIIVYEKRKGVCVEYTNLFLAMIRSLGIPGRAVTGYVYSPEYGWQLHSWGEVYLDKWVGVDPTWLEVGSIDATHIPLFFNHDTILRETVTATTNNRQHLNWIGKGTLGGSTEGIEIVSFKELIPDYNILNLPNEKLHVGKDGTLLFEIDVDHYTIFQANVNPCSYETEIIEMEEEKVIYFLSPGKNFVPINYKISEMLNPNNNYFCPITISHTFGYDVVNLEIQGRKTPESFDVYLSTITDKEISFKVYSNDGLPVNIITNKDEKEIEINRNTISEEIIVKKEGINKKNLIFYNEKTTRYFDLDNLQIGGEEIIPTRIQFKENIPNDIEYYMEIDFEFQGNDEMTISYYLNGVLIETEKTMEREYTFRKKLPNNNGKKDVKVKVNSYSEEFVYENSYEVFTPTLSYEIMNLGEEKYGVLIRGPFKEYEIYVNGEKMNSEHTNLEKGNNEIKIVWVDLAGYERIDVFTHNENGLLPLIGMIFGLSAIFIIYFFRENIMRWFKCKLK